MREKLVFPLPSGVKEIMPLVIDTATEPTPVIQIGPIPEVPPLTEAEPLGDKKIIALDKDGTLFNDMHYFPEIGANEVAKYGVNYDYAYSYLREFAGYPLPEHLAHVLTNPKNGRMIVSDEQYEDILSDVRVQLKELPMVLFPDVVPALTGLRNLGYKLWISSNHPEEHSIKNAEDAGIAGFFKTFVGGTDLEKGESHFEIAAKRMGYELNEFKSQLVYVGDSIPDAETTTRSTFTIEDKGRIVRRRVIFIGRLGFAVPEADDFYEAGASKVVKNLTELAGIVPQIRHSFGAFP